jgi:NAD(P)-dependent dehydrogenase (short-subunit alcohol dehydrogenase family)
METHPLAIITGAGRGIGKTCALGLASLGYQTVLIARNKNRLKEVAEEILNNNSEEVPKPVIIEMDVADFDKTETAIQSVIKKFRRVDVLVNSAGIFYDGTSSISVKEFEELLATNLTAAFGLIKAVVPVMKKQGRGYIFNIASRAGKIGFADSGGYNASKFGLVGLSESLYRELSEFGILVTAICPGWVNTDMAFEAGTPISEDEMIQTSDIFKTIEWLLNLSPATRIKEIVIESNKSIH